MPKDRPDKALQLAAADDAEPFEDHNAPNE
jgi:hypothetical protein